MGALIVFSYRTLRKQETLNSNQGQDILVSDLESQKKKKEAMLLTSCEKKKYNKEMHNTKDKLYWWRIWNRKKR